MGKSTSFDYEDLLRAWLPASPDGSAKSSAYQQRLAIGSTDAITEVARAPEDLGLTLHPQLDALPGGRREVWL